MVRKHQTSDAQLRIGESRDSGFTRFARAPEWQAAPSCPPASDGPPCPL